MKPEVYGFSKLIGMLLPLCALVSCWIADGHQDKQEINKLFFKENDNAT